MRVTRSVEFDAAHRVGDGPVHGHRYRLDLTIAGNVQIAGPGAGTVIERNKLDLVLGSYVLRYHHRTLLYFLDPLFVYVNDAGVVDAAIEQNVLVTRLGDVGFDGMKFVPTLANLATYFANILADQDLGVLEVRLWNTPTSCATAVPGLKCEECMVRGEHAMSCSFYRAG